MFASLVLAATIAATPPESVPPPAPAPYTVHARWAPEPPARSNTRFSVRAQLSPAAPAPAQDARFVLAAKLQAETKAACALPGSIFSNGFEGT